MLYALQKKKTQWAGVRRAAAGPAAASATIALALAAQSDRGLAGDAAYGEYLAGECAGCHSNEADAAIPPLGRLSYDDVVAALRDYREGRRDNAAMQSVARGLGDAEIEALAAYFAGATGAP